MKWGVVYLGVFPCFFSKTAPGCSDPGIYFFFCSVFKVCVLSEVFEFCHFFYFFWSVSISSLSAWSVVYFVFPLCIFKPTFRLSEFRLLRHQYKTTKIFTAFRVFSCTILECKYHSQLETCWGFDCPPICSTVGVIIIALKGQIEIVYNLLTAPPTVSNTHALVARAQSCANHVQNIEHLSRATCRVPSGTKGQLSY